MNSPRQTRTGPAFPMKRVFMVAGVCVLVGGVGYLVFGPDGGTKRRAPAPQVVSIQVPPPPPPPPPPPRPKPPEPSPQTETAQQMVAETAAEPEAAPDAPSNDAPLGTGVKGDGTPDSFGLGTGPGGGGGPRLLGGGGGGGTRWAGYSSAIKTRIIEALGNDPRTRSADGQIEIGIWLDAGGRITRVQIRKSSADPAVDAAITRDVLAGLQTQPPPADMPQPIWMRTTLRRPN